MDDSALRFALQQIAQGLSLNRSEAASAFGVVMEGSATAAQGGALLMGLRAKGETAEEVAGAAQALRCAMVRLEADAAGALVDTCGTGGGRGGQLNTFSAGAFLVG